ncbi:MAG: alpha/beta hydrolase family esterase [Solimonas sp.]
MQRFRSRLMLGLVLLCLSTTSHAGLLDGLSTTIARLSAALQASSAQMRTAFQESMAQIEAAFAQTFDTLAGRYLNPTAGTTSFEETIVSQGIGRTSLYIRPQVDPQGLAPAVIFLHFGRGTPKAMANLVHAGDLAAKYGAWVILPTAENRRWNDDPAETGSIDDVGYLVKVIQAAVAQHPIDPKRIYIAGMSNGGFMTSRFACEHPELIAGAAQVVSSMHKSEAAVCAPKVAVPMTLILGTNDVLVRYNAKFGLLSGPETFARWQQINGCDPSGVLTEQIPDIARDGTTTTYQHNEVCSSGAAAQLYTVNDGGHTWPEGPDADSKLRIGRTSHDFSATEVIWDFFKDYSR